MAIAFDCPACGKSFSVADEFAGRSGTCKACGQMFKVPELPAEIVEEDDEWGVATEGYGLVDAPPKHLERAAQGEDEPNVFARSYEEDFDRPPPRRSSKTGGTKNRRQRDEEGFFAKHGNWLIWSGIALVVILGGVVLFVPGGQLFVGVTLCVVGMISLLVGYILGLYVAFLEDSFHGWLSIIFPFYSAYYLASRWDEMWPSFLIQTAGFLMIMLGGVLVGGRARNAAGINDARFVQPLESRLVVVNAGV